MTADSLQKELSKGWAMLVFQYHGKEGHVDPYDTRDENFSYLLWYDGDENSFTAWRTSCTPPFSTAILFPRSLVTSLKSTGADNNQIPRASLPIRAGALFSCRFSSCWQSAGLQNRKRQVRSLQTVPCSRHKMSGAAIAAGGAYPAHNRTRTENRVTKPRFPHRKELFDHET